LPGTAPGSVISIFSMQNLPLTSCHQFSSLCFVCFGITSLQVSIPLGMYDHLPVSVSLLAKHGSDMFLLSTVEALSGTIKEHIDVAVESDV